MLKSIGAFIQLILAVVQVWQQKRAEAQVLKAAKADALEKANNQIRKADEIDAAPTPTDKRTILDGM